MCSIRTTGTPGSSSSSRTSCGVGIRARSSSTPRANRCPSCSIRLSGPSGSASEDYANAWIAALEPFNVPRKTWICPTIQNGLDSPDYSTADVARIDYFATTFDDKPGTAHEWPKQPWFIETGSVHGNGNLILFTDGSITDLNTVVQSAGSNR